MDVINSAYDDSAHQGCYVFRTAETEPEEIDSRPKKKRMIYKSKHVQSEQPSFPTLLGGLEVESSAKLRQVTFEQLWALRQSGIDKIIAEPNKSSMEAIARFVRHAPISESEAKLPTALVVVGKDGGAQQRLLHQWQSDERTKSAEYLIQLDHNQAVNINSALKSIIRSVISSALGQDGYISFLSKHKRLIPMNYDLELLQCFAKEKKIAKVVISVLDVEAFDISVLSDVLATLASWTDRIPFILLIGISTTVELFEARLPKSVIRRLIPRVFDLSRHAFNPMYKIFMVTQHDTSSDGLLWLGPAAANVLLEKSKEQETTPEIFGQAIKYAYMSHFFANYLSVLVASDQELDEHTEALVCEAARNAPSFMEYVETILNTPGSNGAKVQEVASLLNDDEHLITSVRVNVAEGRTRMKTHYKAVAGLKEMILSLQNTAAVQGQELPQNDFSASSAVSDEIFDASVIALAGPDAVEIMLENIHFYDSLEKMSVDTFHNFLCFKYESTILPLVDSKAHKGLQQRAKALLVNGQRTNIFVSNDPNQATPDQKEYQNIQATFVSLVEDGLKARLVDPTTLPFHEIFIYNSKAPLAQAFTPAPRYAIERALDRPSDYLGCECCVGEDGSSQPPTAILWRLWCEAGGIVNVRDLWEAFRSTLIPHDHEGEDEEASENGGGNERRVLALFYRSLAELQMLGMLKQSKRKPGVECLAKIGWRGM